VRRLPTLRNMLNLLPASRCTFGLVAIGAFRAPMLRSSLLGLCALTVLAARPGRANDRLSCSDCLMQAEWANERVVHIRRSHANAAGASQHLEAYKRHYAVYGKAYAACVRKQPSDHCDPGVSVSYPDRAFEAPTFELPRWQSSWPAYPIAAGSVGNPASPGAGGSAGAGGHANTGQGGSTAVSGLINARTMPYTESAEASAFCHKYEQAIQRATAKPSWKREEDRNYALHNITLGVAGLEFGDLSTAAIGLRNATGVFGAGVGREKGIASVFLSENIKYFKGGVHERQLTYLLQGLAYYQAGQLDNARISFNNALLQDSLVSKPEYADDLALAYYMLGRALQRTGGEADNVRIAFQRAQKASPGCAYCTQEAAASDNAVFLVGLGNPVLRTRGATRTLDAYVPIRTNQKWCDVRIDGKSVGKCAIVWDGGRQIEGRDPAKRHYGQIAKGVAVAGATVGADSAGGALSDAATKGLGGAVKVGVSGSGLGLDRMGWADLRSVPVFPGRIGLVSARIPPGLHTLEVVALDAKGAPVANTAYRREYLAIPEDGETTVYLRTTEYRQTAGAKPTCGTPNQLSYAGEDPRFQTTYMKFWPKGSGRPAFVKAPIAPQAPQACLAGFDCPVGIAPAALLGRDFRPPTKATLREWRKRGYFKGESLRRVQKRYRRAGFVLPGDGDIRQCGKHVALGGKCLVPPPSGTALFDRIVSGGAGGRD
jgi:tetratricopeptide (TPR) repeat protein